MLAHLRCDVCVFVAFPPSSSNMIPPLLREDLVLKDIVVFRPQQTFLLVA